MLATVAISIEICAFTMRHCGLIITLTDSSCAAGIYRLGHRPIVRGALVEACLPDEIASYGIARNYIHSGDCRNGSEPVIKVVGATAGDRVDLTRTNIRVNGIILAQSATRSCDSRGCEVRAVRRGSYETGADQVWLFGFNDPRSWDSRYFGPVSRNSVIGVVEPALVLDRSAHPE